MTIIDSEDEIVSIPDTELDGTVDSVHQGLTDTKITRTGTHLPMMNLTPKSAPV